MHTGFLFVDYEPSPKDLIATLAQSGLSAGEKLLLREVRLAQSRVP